MCANHLQVGGMAA